jgi:tetratricopeptide (TPR) repeat protein
MLDDAVDICRRMLREGKSAEAETLAREALADCERMHGKDDSTVGRCLATLGEMLVQNGHPKEAIEPLSRAFKMLCARPAERLRAAEAIDWLAVAHERLGDVRHVEKALQEGLHFRERAFGKAAPEIADSMDRLFHLFHDVRHDEAQAETALRRALEVLQSAGSDHAPHVVEELRTLGRLYEQESRWEESVRAFDRAVRLKVAIAGAESLELGPMLRELGRAHLHAGDLAHAEYCLRRALVYVDAKHGGTPETALPYVQELTEVLRQAGKSVERQQFEALGVMIRAQSTRPPPRA